ncbi:MAG: polysulfide reductase NrfD [Desulfovibrio sp.]|jgi:Ni/Fe-hydrogenase subunit HybB-like protein|nr:polysulfide reductase NrfD [Desulfovibrio sp.]
MNSECKNNNTLLDCIKNNPVTAIILLVGLGLTVARFTSGIGGVTNLDNKNPWGFWMTFDLLCGIAIAAGGFAVTAAYYVFGQKHFGVFVRSTLTTAFLGYFFEVIALVYEVGQPWRLPYPIFWSQGTSSVLFLIGLCVFAYLMISFTELLPAVLEWLGKKDARKKAIRLVTPLAVIGAVIGIIHQSSLGALYVITPSKVHPLWYTTLMPLNFLVSSLFAGLSMVVVEGLLSHKFLHAYMDGQHIKTANRAVFGCGKAACFFMFAYLAMKVVQMADTSQHLSSGYGALFLAELAGGVALPALMLLTGIARKRTGLIQAGAIVAVLGVVLNRFNVSLVAFNYNLPAAERYFPSWMEIALSVFLFTLMVAAYRFICSRMPVLKTHKEYGEGVV